MRSDPSTDGEVSALRERLAELEETLGAIRRGDVDAIVGTDEAGDVLYTLRTAEQPYRELVEQMHEAAAIVTTSGDVLYGNCELASLLGVGLERLVGSPIAHHLAGPDRDAFLRAIAEGGTCRGRLRAADGTERDVYLSVAVTHRGKVSRHNLVFADLSELATAEDARRRAEQESVAKDHFLAMLGHELRNPLGAMAGALQVLEAAGPGDEREARARAVLQRQIVRLSRLVSDLLDAAGFAVGKMTLDRRRLNWTEVVGACAAAHTRADRRIVTDLAPVWIEGDRVRIEQVVDNLLSNAVKYTKPGGTITIALRPEDDEAVLEVSDDGVGIDANLLPKVFDLFVQGEQPLHRSAGGLGIGLTIVRRVVEVHGGQVRAVSAGEGRGSTFTVVLPRQAAPGAASAGLPQKPAARCRRRVLIVEDSADAREMYREYLELLGHEVFEAGDGWTGLELLNSERPDVALIDIGLPGMDGFEVVERFRRDGSPCGDIVLIALTGYGTSDIQERARAVGFDHHLVKPVSPDTLDALLAGAYRS